MLRHCVQRRSIRLTSDITLKDHARVYIEHRTCTPGHASWAVSSTVEAVTPTSIHDLPVVGHFTLAAQQNLGAQSETRRRELAAFQRLAGERGWVSKTELADGLRTLGKSDREVQELLDDAPQDRLDFDAYSALLSSRSYTTNIASVPFPNLRKTHDVPLLGVVTKATEGLIKASVSTLVAAAELGSGSLSKQQLLKTFQDADVDKTGRLDRGQVEVALRTLDYPETDVSRMLASVHSDVNEQEFMMLIHGHLQSIDDLPLPCCRGR